MSVRSPAFQFYANDWLSSPKIMLMTPAQEGAYIRLLCIAWNDPDCSLPDDDEELADLSRLGEGWFNGGSTRIRKCFEPHPTKPERLVNKRLLEERAKQEDWREKSKIGGLRSGESRRKKYKKQTKGGSQMVEPEANQSPTLLLQSSSSINTSIPPSEDRSRSRSQSSRSRRSQACDEDWLTELQAKPAYQHLNVAVCYSKMVSWCEVKSKQPTRSRLLNWLNREEQPMTVAAHSGVNGHHPPSKSEQIARQNDAAGEEWLRARAAKRNSVEGVIADD